MAKKTVNPENNEAVERIIYITNRAFCAKVKKVDENGKTIKIAHPETGVPMKDMYEEHTVKFTYRGHRINGAEKLHEFMCMVDETIPKEIRDRLAYLAKTGAIMDEETYIRFVNPEQASAEAKANELSKENKTLQSKLSEMQSRLEALEKGA